MMMLAMQVLVRKPRHRDRVVIDNTLERVAGSLDRIWYQVPFSLRHVPRNTP